MSKKRKLEPTFGVDWQDNKIECHLCDGCHRDGLCEGHKVEVFKESNFWDCEECDYKLGKCTKCHEATYPIPCDFCDEGVQCEDSGNACVFFCSGPNCEKKGCRGLDYEKVEGKELWHVSDEDCGHVWIFSPCCKSLGYAGELFCSDECFKKHMENHKLPKSKDPNEPVIKFLKPFK